jgi:hypothetical protein
VCYGERQRDGVDAVKGFGKIQALVVGGTNDPIPGPLAVMSVMTADADAVEIDPPKIKAAISDFVFIFICWSQKDLRTIFIARLRCARKLNPPRPLTNCPLEIKCLI